MRRFKLLIGITIFTFSFGVAVVWCWLSFSKTTVEFFDSLGEKEVPTFVSTELPINSLSEQVQIKFLSSEERNAPGYIFLTFQVANGSSETLYYKGSGRYWHSSYKIKRRNMIEQEEHPQTWNERTLSPGETAIYDVAVFLQSKTNEVEIGFDFDVGQERRKETIWTEKVVIKK